jgi:hypothetical protein
MNISIPKDPDAVLDYAFDWSNWLVVGDELDDAEWTVDGDDEALVVLSSGGRAPSETATVAKCWLSGGTAGVDYRLTCRVTTTAGRIDDRTITIAVSER